MVCTGRDLMISSSTCPNVHPLGCFMISFKHFWASCSSLSTLACACSALPDIWRSWAISGKVDKTSWRRIVQHNPWRNAASHFWSTFDRAIFSPSVTRGSWCTASLRTALAAKLPWDPSKEANLMWPHWPSLPPLDSMRRLLNDRISSPSGP